MHLEQQKRGLIDFPVSETPYEVTSITANNNRITQIPNITEYVNLKRLALNNNEISKIDASISYLKHISWLDLTRNKLKDLPSEMETLNLLGFGLSENKFKEIPSCVLKMSRLQKFGFFSNYLLKVPVELFNLKDLTKLDLSSNQLTEIPIEILNLKKLTWLNLSNNKLKKIPDFSCLEELEELGLGNNCLTELPFLTNKNLKILPVYRNNLKEINVHLENIKKLDFSENVIETPRIYAPNCTYLNLRNNKIKDFQIFVSPNCLVDLRENNLKRIPLKFYRLTKTGPLKTNNNPFSTKKKTLKEPELSLKDICLSKISNIGKGNITNNINNNINNNDYRKLINKLLEILNCYTKDLISPRKIIKLEKDISFIIRENKELDSDLNKQKALVFLFKKYTGTNRRELSDISEMFIKEINKTMPLVKTPLKTNLLDQINQKNNLFIKPIISKNIQFKNPNSVFNKFLLDFQTKRSHANIYFLFSFCQEIINSKNVEFVNKIMGIQANGFILESKINYCDSCGSVFYGNKYDKSVSLINSSGFCVVYVVCCSFSCLKTCISELPS
ncbi:Adenylate cyclase [Cucumispora dikerogammari]|nr:Adenylate cyclase [Cucumispora dikerogammari]